MAQTQKRDIDPDFFEFDLYPFELAKKFGKWGLIYKSVYDRPLAVSYFKRNFHYNSRLDTLMKTEWLAPPVYDKFERWTYGLRFQFLLGIGGNKTDLYSLAGELLAKDISELRVDKSGEERSNSLIFLKSGSKWKWIYEGDFYKSGSTVYYSSPLFDTMEVIRDSVTQTFAFKTEGKGKRILFSELGHPLWTEIMYAYKEPETAATDVVENTVNSKQQEEATSKSKPVSTIKESPVSEEISYEEKLAELDRMLGFQLFRKNGLFGIKSAKGKVLIYPAIESIQFIYPSEQQLEIINMFATLQFVINGRMYEITKSNFGGPERLECNGNVMLTWNIGTGRYE